MFAPGTLMSMDCSSSIHLPGNPQFVLERQPGFLEHFFDAPGRANPSMIASPKAVIGSRQASMAAQTCCFKCSRSGMGTLLETIQPAGRISTLLCPPSSNGTVTMPSRSETMVVWSLMVTT